MQEDEDESMLAETFVDDNDMHDIIHVSNLFENKGRSKGGSDRQLISTCLRLVLLVYSFPGTFSTTATLIVNVGVYLGKVRKYEPSILTPRGSSLYKSLR